MQLQVDPDRLPGEQLGLPRLFGKPGQRRDDPVPAGIEIRHQVIAHVIGHEAASAFRADVRERNRDARQHRARAVGHGSCEGGERRLGQGGSGADREQTGNQDRPKSMDAQHASTPASERVDRGRAEVVDPTLIPATTINAELAEPALTRGVRLQADFFQSGCLSSLKSQVSSLNAQRL